MFALFLDCYAMGRHRGLPLHDHAFGGREMKSITEQDSMAQGKVEGCRMGSTLHAIIVAGTYSGI
ncbi:MAG: hypothetical protein D3920_15275 [Candidatus Electrothrix sp. AW2]|nr:hypothetical protein [Candidatus Electrothrix gigas]